jgi:hypothetical protein
MSRIVGLLKDFVRGSKLVRGKEKNIQTPNLEKRPRTSNSIGVWGISATIGNLDQAMEVLLAPLACWAMKKERSFGRSYTRRSKWNR